MPRSTLRCALSAGALCLTATAAIPAVADAAPKVGVSAKRLNIQTGGRVAVKGRIPAPGTVRLQVQRGQRWVTIRRDRTDAEGRYVLRKRLNRPVSTRARVTSSLGGKRVIGRLNVYRRALASWYGPGLFGNKLGCGGRLQYGSIGVAHKTLPCGTKLTIRHNGRSVRVPVIDRGPYVGGREFDLTEATAKRLRFHGHGRILTTR
jgi:rare lipoprotein A